MRHCSCILIVLLIYCTYSGTSYITNSLNLGKPLHKQTIYFCAHEIRWIKMRIKVSRIAETSVQQLFLSPKVSVMERFHCT